VRLGAIAELDRRIVTVFHRLVTANVELCPARGWAAGWALHSAGQYDRALRDVLVAEGLEGDLPAVSAVAPDGPADEAGLSRGDVVLSANGAHMAVGVPTDRASYEGFAANIGVIEAALHDRPELRLVARRDGRTREVVLQGDLACDYRVHLDVSDELNARADGRAIHISSALAQFAVTDDELALILAHELAHNVLEHREHFDRAAPARRVFGNLAVSPSSLAAAERDADRWGLYLMARAGFDERVAAPFWRRFGAANWRVRWAQWGHPSAETRARQLEGVTAEIAMVRASGRQIDPR